MSAPPPTRVPVPIEDMLERLHLPQSSSGMPLGLKGAPSPGRLLQDFRALPDSVEWQLARAYWSEAGVLPFVDNEVPFLINNDGRLSARAAALFFAHCAESQLPARIQILELGAGTGLFARYFLDAFQALCEQDNRDFYSRLSYIITDRSRRTVEQWTERKIFARHRDHVSPAIFDPTAGSRPRTLDGEALEVSGLRAVFCNYVLDVLPSTIVRMQENVPEELRVRTYLAAEPHLLARYTNESSEQIRDSLASGEESNLASLFPILQLLEYETKFHPVGKENIPHLDEALEWGDGLDRVLLNYGAYDALTILAGSLDPDGFVLVNDYGPVKREDVPQQSGSQRFGPTLAFGINFPLLEHHWSAAGAVVLRPEGDDERGIHTRLLARTVPPETRAAFMRLFSAESQAEMEASVQRARVHASAGRWNDALESYREALTCNPPCWHLIGEAAEFVSLQLRSFEAGLEMIRAALELNPYYSSWLWNVLGDTLYCLERYQDAHEAYMQAARIHPQDARTNLNLAYTHLHFYRYAEALEAVTTGLLYDLHGVYRTRLLEKQQGILALLSAQREADAERALRRIIRFQ